MPFIKITASATGTVPVIPTAPSVPANVPFQWVTFQNQGSANMYVADDPAVTNGYGTLILPGGAITFGPAIHDSTDLNLTHWFVYQASGGICAVQYA